MTLDDRDARIAPDATELFAADFPLLRRTVLLVDDDAKVLRSLQRVLAEEEYQVMTAISASEAQAIVSAHRVDLILCDNLMVGIMGTEFLAGIHEEHPEIILMMLSGYMPQSVADKVMRENGVSRIFSKPCSANKVAAAFRVALESTADK